MRSAMEAFAERGWPAELIVCDNNSDDRTAQIARAAGARVVFEAAAFRELGGFNEQLYAGEEIDLFRRLKRLARRKARTVVILHRHPLHTSDRKLRLYTWREHLAFLLRTCASAGRTLRRRDQCSVWYDGRR